MHKNSLLKEALDENTPTERLREIANNSNKAIRTAVAANPNTPPDVLIECFYEVPATVLKNPAIQLILLEKPDFFNELISHNPYIFNEELPLFFIEWASLHPKKSIRESLAESDITPEHILSRLAKDKDDEVRRKIAANLKAPSDALEKLAVDKNAKIRIAVAENLSVPEAILVMLAEDEDYHVRSKVAANQKTPINTLYKLAKDTCGMVRLAVVENSCISFGISDNIVRNLVELDINILRNIKLPLACFEWAINHASEDIRLAVANNPQTPQSILDKLVNDKLTEVRLAVAQNSHTSKNSLNKLIYDENESIGFIAALQLKQKLEDYYFDDDENPF